jgi:hypothetical protein
MLEIVASLHGDRGANPGKAVDHGADHLCDQIKVVLQLSRAACALPQTTRSESYPIIAEGLGWHRSKLQTIAKP